MKNLLQLLLCLMPAYASLAAPPTITSFSPSAASAGMTVTINGTGFSASTTVSFGGTAAASVSYVSSTQLKAVVAYGSSGNVLISNASGIATSAGFIYLPTSSIITDFNGYWFASGADPNPVTVDSSHHLIAFTYNGVTWSTGVNNAILDARNITYSQGNFRALPVAGIAGITAAVGSNSTYLALAKKVDGSPNVANTPAVANFSVRNSLVDGIRGLDLGTGVTNLPTSAILTFEISNIDPAHVDDNEPDIILTQIAQPVTGNDIFSFLDASGNVVGSPVTQNMFILPKFGSYDLDLFHLIPNTSYNTATAYSAFATNTNREIRVVGFKLSDFGISPANAPLVKALRITPSGNSDYAFIAYNADAINLPPNITRDDANTNTNICAGGTAQLAVLASAVGNGTLTYSWERSTNNGATWTIVNDGAGISGATTPQLQVTAPGDGHQYRATVVESGNDKSAISPVFTINHFSSTPPSAVSITGGGSVCLNTALQLSSNVTGGSNLYYQWQSNAGGSFASITNANAAFYTPPVNQTGTIQYRVLVSSGNGCGSVLSAAVPVTVTGISSVTNQAVCGSGIMQLAAAATSGNIDWYTSDAGGSPIFTGLLLTTPLLSGTTTYYVTASGCTNAFRVPVTATVHPLTIPGLVVAPTSVTQGNSATLTLNGFTGNVLKWQWSTNNFVSNIHDIASTSPQLVVNNISQTKSYRAVVQSGSCSSAASIPATIVASPALAIHNKSLKATRVATGVEVQWTAYDQAQTASFDVERSADGISFTKLYTTPVAEPHTSHTYKWIDIYPLEGNNFYRIREQYIPGNADHSIVVKVQVEKNQSIRIYPTIISGRQLNIQFPQNTASVNLRLYNSAGQTVFEQTIRRNQSSPAIEVVHLPAALVTGSYHATFTSSEMKTQSLQVVLLP